MPLVQNIPLRITMAEFQTFLFYLSFLSLGKLYELYSKEAAIEFKQKPTHISVQVCNCENFLLYYQLMRNLTNGLIIDGCY